MASRPVIAPNEPFRCPSDLDARSAVVDTALPHDHPGVFLDIVALQLDHPYRQREAQRGDERDWEDKFPCRGSPPVIGMIVRHGSTIRP